MLSSLCASLALLVTPPHSAPLPAPAPPESPGVLGVLGVPAVPADPHPAADDTGDTDDTDDLEFDDDTLRRAWQKAKKSARKKFPDALEEEVAQLETHQLRLARGLIEAADLNLRKVPELLGAEFYDPKVHARNEPVKRKVADPESSASMSLQREIFRSIPERGLQPAYAYDYGTGQVVRIVEEPDDPDRLFANALAGFAPGLDLAEALVEAALDDGAQQKAAAAFGHAYSDRDGRGYPAITIYDAWCSGREIEMPDVECLGIIHDVLDDWDTWEAPISSSKQGSLYARLGELFTDLRRHRGLRHALTRCYLNGTAVLRDDYESQLGTFQALWTTVEEKPEALAELLPESLGWRDWLVETAERIDEDEDFAWEEGQERIAVLDADREALRPCLVRAMRACKILRD